MLINVSRHTHVVPVCLTQTLNRNKSVQQIVDLLSNSPSSKREIIYFFSTRNQQILVDILNHSLKNLGFFRCDCRLVTETWPSLALSALLPTIPCPDMPFRLFSVNQLTPDIHHVHE